MLSRLLFPTLVACLVLLLATTGPAFALDVLVSTSAQLSSACKNAAPGHVIKIASGTYQGPFTLAGKTSVTLRSYNGTVTLRGNPDPNTAGMDILTIDNSSNINVQGLKFAENWGNGADGIKVQGAGTAVTISACEFYNIGWSKSKTARPDSSRNAHAIIVVGSLPISYTRVIIRGNSIHDCITGYSESLTVTGNVSSFRIEGNTLRGNTNIGIDCAGHYGWTGAPAEVNFARYGVVKNNSVYQYAGPSKFPASAGIYVDGGSNITVEHNRVYNYKVGISVGCESPGKKNMGNIVRNNLIYSDSLSGIFVGSASLNSMVHNTRITNNTFYKNGCCQTDDGQIYLLNNSGTVIKNNIFYPTNNRKALVQQNNTTSTNLTVSHNLYYRDNGDTTNLYHNVSGDKYAVKRNPLFVNAPLNFHLQAVSPAINKGDPAFVAPGELDLDAQARVLDNRVDIGVDEVPRTAPAAPSGLAVPMISYFQVKLTWKDNSNNEMGFKIERSKGSSTTFTQIATVGVGVTAYTDIALAPTTKYNYRVRAYNTAGNSAYTAVVSVTTTGLVLAQMPSPDAESGTAFAVSLYPNPITQEEATVLLQLAKDSPVSVSVYTLAGRKVADLLQHKTLPKGRLSLPLHIRDHHLQRGIYLLRVVHAEGFKIIRFSVP
jgi:Right handed beta helix region